LHKETRRLLAVTDALRVAEGGMSIQERNPDCMRWRRAGLVGASSLS